MAAYICPVPSPTRKGHVVASRPSISAPTAERDVVSALIILHGTQARCAWSGGAWSLWRVLFLGRTCPEGGTSSSPHLNGREEYEHISNPNIYAPPPGWTVEVLKDAPRHRRSAALLHSVGRSEKAEDEENCGIPLKGKCIARHGVVRQGKSTGKTRWCAGCNTETSARYTKITFPEGGYTILRLGRDLGPLYYDAAEIGEGVWELDPKDADEIQHQIEGDYRASTNQFRRVQRSYPDELFGWSYAVSQVGEMRLVSELRVLMKHTERLKQVLRDITGITRRKALWTAIWVRRYDYSEYIGEQSRRDWAALFKTTLLHLDVDALFVPIWHALDKKQLSQAYGDLRQVYSEEVEARQTS